MLKNVFTNHVFCLWLSAIFVLNKPVPHESNGAQSPVNTNLFCPYLAHLYSALGGSFVLDCLFLVIFHYSTGFICAAIVTKSIQANASKSARLPSPKFPVLLPIVNYFISVVFYFPLPMI